MIDNLIKNLSHLQDHFLVVVFSRDTVEQWNTLGATPNWPVREVYKCIARVCPPRPGRSVSLPLMGSVANNGLATT